MSIKAGQRYRNNLTNDVVKVKTVTLNSDGTTQVFYYVEDHPYNIASVKDLHFSSKHTLMIETEEEVPDLPKPPSNYCFHVWKLYTGFREEYYYCSKCGKVKED